MTSNIKILRTIADNLSPAEIIDAFEIIRLAAEKNKSGVKNRQKKVKEKIKELQHYKIFKDEP